MTTIETTERLSLCQRYGRQQLCIAQVTLTEFVFQQAEATKAEVGFGWVAQVEAPSRYDDLCAAYAHSIETGGTLPISSENNQDTIYTTPEANVTMRFWHDVNHVRRGLSFELVDELELGLWHLAVLEEAGFERPSLPYRLLHADLIGQAQVMAFARRFPLEQERFVRGCLSDGFDAGVLAEARRGP